MLILVGISVTVALNGGLFETAKKAAEETKIAAGKEQDILSMGTWLQSGTTLKNVATGDTIQIGAKVDYNEGTDVQTNMEWRVLGVNDLGQVELISTIPTTETVELKGKDGYLNAVTILDEACSAYGKGEGVAKVRSLTADDINKLAEYDPTDYTGYGTKYTYKYASGSVYGIPSASITDANKDNITGWTDTGGTDFYTPDWTINSTSVGPVELDNTHYNYAVATELEEKTPDNVSWVEIITKGEGGTSYVNQWLATPAMDSYDNCAFFLVFQVNFDSVSATNVCDSMGGVSGDSKAVRPVVSLKSSIQLTDTDNDGVYEF